MSYLVKDHPFKPSREGIWYPLLPVRITSLVSYESVEEYALLDTGADDCAIPSLLGPDLGVVVSTGRRRTRHGLGSASAFGHDVRIEILDEQFKPIFEVSEKTVDFCDGLQTVLLGVNGFLQHFIISIDYPGRTFSIRRP